MRPATLNQKRSAINIIRDERRTIWQTHIYSYQQTPYDWWNVVRKKDLQVLYIVYQIKIYCSCFIYYFKMFCNLILLLNLDTFPVLQDLNGIENIWANMKHHLRKNIKPRNKELVNGISDYWSKLTPETCKNYVLHVHKVVPEVVKCEGGATKY